jgi:hypothetical protein
MEQVFRSLRSEWIPSRGYNSEAEELAKKVFEYALPQQCYSYELLTQFINMLPVIMLRY